jgi:hypothetical protein
MPDIPAAEAFAFQGRTCAEYERVFDFDPGRWDAVLDCGAGKFPSGSSPAPRRCWP